MVQTVGIFKLYIYKRKNHFSEMKGDVGISLHEKEGKQEDAYTKTRNSFITPSLHLCSCHTFSYITTASTQYFYPQTDSYTSERNKDVGMGL